MVLDVCVIRKVCSIKVCPYATSRADVEAIPFAERVGRTVTFTMGAEVRGSTPMFTAIVLTVPHASRPSKIQAVVIATNQATRTLIVPIAVT